MSNDKVEKFQGLFIFFQEIILTLAKRDFSTQNIFSLHLFEDQNFNIVSGMHEIIWVDDDKASMHVTSMNEKGQN